MSTLFTFWRSFLKYGYIFIYFKKAYQKNFTLHPNDFPYSLYPEYMEHNAKKRIKQKALLYREIWVFTNECYRNISGHFQTAKSHPLTFLIVQRRGRRRLRQNIQERGQSM